MFIKLRKRMAQSTTEYAILLGVIIAAIAAMQTYVKRSFQAKIKDTTQSRDIGGGVTIDSTVFTTSQYEPYYLHSESDRFSAQREKTAFDEGDTEKESYTAAGRTGKTKYKLDEGEDEFERTY